MVSLSNHEGLWVTVPVGVNVTVVGYIGVNYNTNDANVLYSGSPGPMPTRVVEWVPEGVTIQSVTIANPTLYEVRAYVYKGQGPTADKVYYIIDIPTVKTAVINRDGMVGGMGVTGPQGPVGPTGPSGASLTQVVISTDADIVVNPGTRVYLPPGILTANRNLDLDALNTDGDYAEIFNHDEGGFLFLKPGTVLYRYNEVVPTDEPLMIATYRITLVDGKLLQ